MKLKEMVRKVTVLPRESHLRVSCRNINEIKMESSDQSSF